MEKLDFNSQQRRETFALYGLAMYHAQCFEKSLVIIVSTAYNKKYFKSDFEQREDLFNNSFKKTAGQLVSKLKEMVRVSDDLENILVKAVNKSNWFVLSNLSTSVGVGGVTIANIVCVPDTLFKTPILSKHTLLVFELLISIVIVLFSTLKFNIIYLLLSVVLKQHLHYFNFKHHLSSKLPNSHHPP